MVKTKQQKRAERRKRVRKERNVRRNRAKPRYVLEVREHPEAPWREAREFRTEKEATNHVVATEEIRRRKAADIIEGRVRCLRTRKIVATIPAYERGSAEGESASEAAIRTKGGVGQGISSGRLDSSVDDVV